MRDVFDHVHAANYPHVSSQQARRGEKTKELEPQRQTSEIQLMPPVKTLVIEEFEKQQRCKTMVFPFPQNVASESFLRASHKASTDIY